ncbi:MAG: phosphoenolpyruvate carboxylase [Gammaproteobacteria bacterium]|nr:phosphoenolpyruvate carboxylase [Gammaproteobacteria bacterium]
MTPHEDRVRTFGALPDQLRSDVRILGDILGEVIADARGVEFVETIEDIRATAKQARDPLEDSLEPLAAVLATIPDDQVVDVARAFNQFLNLANVAEQRYNTKDFENSFNSAWTELQGRFGDELSSILQEVRIELVLTAHPTEVLRRTLIRKYEAISGALDRYHHSGDELTLRRLIAEVWHTDEIRQQRPTPQDEAKWGFAVIEHSLWDAVPKILRHVDEALINGGNSRLSLDTRLFTFSSWMGGDRDGNPNVTAETTKDVLRLARWMAADLFLRDVNVLIDSLSMNVCSDELTDRVGPVHEPYREVLRELRGKLETTRDDAELRQSNTDNLLRSSEELIEPLLACHRSLVECELDSIANGPLLDTIRRAYCFGVNLCSLDVRQDAARHSEVFVELIAHFDDDTKPYEQWEEEEKTAFLLRELASNRPLIPREWQPSSAVSEVLSTFKTIEREPDEGLANYVISMAAQPSDVLHVALLMKELVGHQKMPIVPLLETLDDLDNAVTLLETLLSSPWYRECIAEQGNRLQIMIGYSDSAKDVGQFAAAWAQFRAQEELSNVAKRYGIALTLFHGRGGTVGRGGGPAHEAIMSQPADSIRGRLRVTEQGEMIRFKLGNPNIALHTLSRYLFSTVEATLSPPSPPSPTMRAAVDKLSAESIRSYRQEVGTQLFAETFEALTPESELAELALGSRPSRRKHASDVFSLRAIPWVFAWTQVRLMLPAWLGYSPVIDELLNNREQFTELMNWPFFRTQIELLEMILAKAEAEIIRQYQDKLIEGEHAQKTTDLVNELENLKEQFLRLIGSPDLLATQSELRESLQVRNTYLDPLHLLQAELLHRRRTLGDRGETNNRALKVTMAGISSGLRNTG